MSSTLYRARHVAIAAVLITAPAASAATFAGVTLTAPPAVAVCHDPLLPSGDAISVDAAGNADTPPTGKPRTTELVCTDGTWVPVSGYGG